MKKIIESFKKTLIRVLINLIHNDFDVYSLEIINTNDKKAKAILFGFNKFINHSNFGSDVRVKVKNNYSTYEHILYESQAPTEIVKMQIISNKTGLKNKIIKHIKNKASGFYFCKPIILKDHYSDLQKNDKIIKVYETININANTYLEIELEPHEELSILFFDKNIFDKLDNKSDK